MAKEGKLKKCEDCMKEDNDKVSNLQFTEAIDDLIIEENCDAVFECKVEGYPPPKCYWYKDGKPLKSNQKTKIIEQHPWYRLEIVSVEPKDHGIYYVICKNDSSFIIQKANLYITKGVSNVLYIYAKNNFDIGRHLSNVKLNTGESVHLEALINSEVNTSCFWYKNGKLLNDNKETKIKTLKNRYCLIIDTATSEDTGIYCIVVKNEYGIVSSYANVEVLDNWELNGSVKDRRSDISIINDEDEAIFIEEHLPEEIEANENEDVRLTCIAKVDLDTKVEWFKDKKVLNINSIPEDYGHNYIGLRIKSPTKSDTGDYSVVLSNEKTGEVDSSNCFVTVNASPIKCHPVVNLKKPLQSVIGSYGSKIIFDCIFDHDDLKYFYVVWYVGHYRVERSNTKFSVINKDGHFFLYIKILEPDMGGQVICELRRAYSHQKGVTVNTTTAYLTVVPQVVIDEEKNRLEHTSDRIYCGTANVQCDPVNQHTSNYAKSNGFSAGIQTDIILDITYCRLDEDGYYYMYATKGENLHSPARVKVHNKKKNGRTSDTTVIEWEDDVAPGSVWYKIEFYEKNHYYGIGISSKASFDVECPSVEKMMQFRIRKSCPLEEYCEYAVSIAPALEPKPIPIKIHNLKPMELFEKEYTKTGDVIGCGAFGSVTLVKNAVGEYLAAKILKTRTQKKRDTAMREYETMKKLRHPKLVELIDAYVTKDMFVFIMDYLWGGELFDRIVDEEHIKEVDVVPYVRQICEALQYMHTKKIAHLDLKPENIICLNPNSGQVKIIDFGLARELVEGNITRAIYGTREYVAPEVLNFETLTLACDMWSLGVVTYMLLSGVMPFAGESWPERSANIIMANYNYDETAFSEISELAKDFVDQLLVLEANKRMSANEALKHRWIVEGPPKGMRAGHMKRARENLKSYLANYRARWQRAGNVMIAALRLRTHANSLRGVVHQSVAPCVT